MPREYQTAIRGRNLDPQTPNPVNYEVAATPVDTTITPSKTNGALRLAESLSTLHTGLTPYVQKKLKEEEDKQYQQGMLGYLSGENPEGQSDSYTDGYMALKWEDFGRQAATEVISKFDELKADPELDVRGLVYEKITKDLAGLQEDPRAIKAYTDKVMPLLGQLQLKHQEYHKAIRDEQTGLLLNSRMKDIVATGESPEDIHQKYVLDWPTWQAMGKSRPDMANALWDNLVAAADESLDTEVLRAALITDESGVSLATVIGEEKVKDKIAEIEKAQKVKRIKDAMVEHGETLANIEILLQTDPHNKMLDPENLKNLVGEELPLDTPEKYASIVRRVHEARNQATEVDATYAHMVNNQNPQVWRIATETPEGKKAYDMLTSEIMAKPGALEPSNISNTLGSLYHYYQLSGEPPKELKGLLKGARVALVDATNGRVSPDLLLQLQVYKAAKDAGMMSMLEGAMDEKDLSALAAINARLKNGPVTGETLAETVQAIRISESDKDIQANAAVLNTKQFDDALTKAVTSEFSSVLDFLPGFTKDATNASVIVRRAKQIAATEVTQNGMSPEDAMEVAVERVKNYFTVDSNGVAFEVHKNDLNNKEYLSKGLDIWLKEFSQKNGELGNYAIYPNEDGKTYRVYSRATALPYVVTSEELLSKAMPSSFGTPKMRSEAATLLGEIKTHLDKSNYVSPQLLEKLESNPELTATILASGEIGFRERLLIKRQLTAYNNQRMDKVRQYVQNLKELTKHGAVSSSSDQLSVNIPAKLVDGTPRNIAELAQYYYKSSPEAALVMVGEGLVTRAKKDSNGAMAIGFGYNFGARSVDQARKDLRAAGVPTADLADVMAGRKEIKVEQAIKLFQNTHQKYKDIAAKAYGSDFEELPRHVQAVLFDMAYNAGTPSKFTNTLKLFKEGKYKEAASQLTLKYKDESGKWRNNERRVQLWREMLSGKFDKYLDFYIKKGK